MDSTLNIYGLTFFVVGIILLIMSFRGKFDKKKSLLLILLGFAILTMDGMVVDTTTNLYSNDETIDIAEETILETPIIDTSLNDKTIDAAKETTPETDAKNYLEEFINKSEGTWIIKNRDNNHSFEFMNFSEGTVTPGVYPGEFGRTGTIVDTDFEESTYVVNVCLPEAEESVMYEAMPEEYITYKICINNGEMTVDFIKNNVSINKKVYVYTNKSLDMVYDEINYPKESSEEYQGSSSSDYENQDIRVLKVDGSRTDKSYNGHSAMSDIRVIWSNNSNKTIKYIHFTIAPYNAVQDIVSCVKTGTTEQTITCTGPFEPRENCVPKWMFYKDSIYHIDIDVDGQKYISYNNYGEKTGKEYITGDDLAEYFDSYERYYLTENDYDYTFENYSDGNIKWYNNDIKSIKLEEVFVEYMDGSNETIKCPTIWKDVFLN